uniref:Na_Ca_ex domain-containing protein n=1 Tax=Caenorhabditis tropicalis TaxID=1561998 RepID=A0A1I7SZP8_9PELO
MTRPVLICLLLLVSNSEAQIAQLFQPYLTGPTRPSNYTPLVLTDELCSQDECLIEKHWTQDDVCAYVKCNKDACEGGGYLQWSQYVKCEHSNAIRAILMTLGVVYLFFLFVVMTVVADDYFSPSIAGIVRHLKISESIAGVTFLAFGNGAPDVFGSIASVITTPKPKADLAIGDILGGGIFVTTVVLSAIIITKSFRIAVLATVRDIVFFIIADIFIAIWFLNFNHVEIWMPLTFLGLYAAYVASVILMRLNSQRRKRARHLKAENERKESTVNHHTHKMSTVIGFFMDYAHVINFFANKKISSMTTNVKSFLDAKDDSLEDGLVDEDTDDDEGVEAEFHYAHRHVYKSYDEASLAFTDVEEIQPKTWKSWDWVRDVANHLKPWPAREELNEMNYFSRFISFVSILPNFFFKLTIPSNEMPWSKPILIVHCFCSVQLALFAVQISTKSPFHGSPGLWIYGLLVSAVLSVLALIFTPLDREQKHYREVYSYLGFLMSIAWIYTTSSEIINVITMIGVSTGVSQEILGLTIMAWSNCIGDVVSDVAVVKQGFPKMAMAAAIGGPLFNLLIGFGLPFTIACLQGKQIELQITPVYRLLMLFLAISLFTSLIAIFVQKFKVRWPHAVALLTVFVSFLVFVLLSETHVLVWK